MRVIRSVVPDGVRNRGRARIDDIVAVGAQRDLVVAALEQVAAGRAIGVRVRVAVRGHVLLREGERERLALARGEKFGLVEGDEVRDGLLDLVVDVELRVGSTVVELDDVLARVGVTRVRDGHLHVDVITRVVVADDLLGEARVRETVAKGVGDGTRRRRGPLAVERSIGEGVVHHVSGLVVAIADVDALLVVGVVAIELADLAAERGA